MCGSSEADCDAVKAKVHEIQNIVMFHFRRNYAIKLVLKTVLGFPRRMLLLSMYLQVHG